MADASRPSRPLLACPAHDELRGLVETMLPGRSGAVLKLRDHIVGFCANPSARAVLLEGPVGSGKSSVARLIGFGKRIAPLRPDQARRRIKNLRFDGPGRIEVKSMSWYVELTVTGLVDTLASAQLFGVKRGAATDVLGGPGVFEQASTGRGGDPEGGAGATGGVVFLDEIADLSSELQAKLLPVLSGGTFYLVGGEGNTEFEREFDGVVVTATWRDPRTLRSDLLSRIAATVIAIPGVSERREDLADILESVYESVVTRHRVRLEKMKRRDPAVDSGFYEREVIPQLPVGCLQMIEQVDWSRYGEFRGLTNAIERVVLGGEDLGEVLRTLQLVEAPAERVAGDALGLYESLLTQGPMTYGLAGRVREIEKRQRAQLRELLADSRKMARLAQAIGVDEKGLADQVRQLDRSRREQRQGRGDS